MPPTHRGPDKVLDKNGPDGDEAQNSGPYRGRSFYPHPRPGHFCVLSPGAASKTLRVGAGVISAARKCQLIAADENQKEAR